MSMLGVFTGKNVWYKNGKATLTQVSGGSPESSMG
jgi:hypothetical protein